MISIDEMCDKLRRCYECTLRASCVGCPYNGFKLDIIQYLKDNMSEIERKRRLLDKLKRKEYITDSDIGISNNKQKSRLDDVPLNTPVFLIDANHNLYTGTIISTDRGLQRGECLSGNAESFYRNAIVDWAYL